MSTESDKVNTSALATIVAVGTFGVVGIAAAVTALVRYDVEVEQGAKNVENTHGFRELVTEQSSKLASSPHWINRQKGVVALPIDRAMQLVVKELERDPSRATLVKTEPTPAPPAGGVAGAGGAGSSTASPLGPGGRAGSGTINLGKPGDIPKVEHTRPPGGLAGSPAVAPKPSAAAAGQTHH